MISWYNAEDAEFFDESNIQIAISALPDDAGPDLIADLVVECGECAGVLFNEICVLDSADIEIGEISANFDHTVSNARRTPANILIGLGIVEKIDFKGAVNRYSPSLRFYVRGYRITELGILFYKTCVGNLKKSDLEQQLDFDDEGAGFSDWLDAKTTQ